MKRLVVLAVLLGALSLQAEEVTRTVTVRTPQGEITGATLRIDDKFATLAMPDKGGGMLLVIRPEQFAVLRSLALATPDAESLVAVPHEATGARKNAFVKNIVLDLPARDSLLVEGVLADVSYPHQAGNLKETVRARVPASWITKPYAFDHKELAVDLGEGPLKAELVEMGPTGGSGPRQAKVKVNGREQSVPAASLLYFDSANPPTEAVQWRQAFPDRIGDEVRREFYRIEAARLREFTWSTPSVRRTAVESTVPVWQRLAMEARSPADFLKAMRNMPEAPIPASLTNPADRNLFRRATGTAFPTHQLTRDLTLLRTLPHFVNLRPSLDEYRELLVQHSISPEVHSFLKRQALGKVRTAEDFATLALTRGGGFREGDKLEAVHDLEEAEFLVRYLDSHFFKKGGKLAGFLDLVDKTPFPQATAAEQLMRLVPGFIANGGDFGTFLKLLARVPEVQRSYFLEKALPELAKGPAPTVAQIQALLRTGLDRDAVAALMRTAAGSELKVEKTSDVTALARAVRVGTFEVPGRNAEAAADEMHRRELYSNLLLKSVLPQILETKPSAADLIALGQEATDAETQIKLIPAAAERADSAKEFLQALALAKPMNSGAREFIRNYLLKEFEAKFLRLDPTVSEINALIWGDSLRLDSATRQELLLHVLPKLRAKSDYRALMLPPNHLQGEELREAHQALLKDHPDWARGWLSTLCLNVRYLNRPRR